MLLLKIVQILDLIFLILKMLVHDDGECTMLRRFWSDLHIEEEAV